MITLIKVSERKHQFIHLDTEERVLILMLETITRRHKIHKETHIQGATLCVHTLDLLPAEF